MDITHAAARFTSRPTVVLLIGMAGGGKTALTGRLKEHLINTSRVLAINMDPAVEGDLPYTVNIDIRDSVPYREIMEKLNLGPNGAIMTCLNLFASRFDQVLSELEAKADEVDYILIDTPGQMEVFNWGASGTVITETLASAFPTLLVYVVDTPRCTRAVTFMSNLTVASSIMYKNQLPFVFCFNKSDMTSPDRCLEWLSNYEALDEALSQDESYLACFSKSLALGIMDFYEDIPTVAVSAATGNGLTKLREKMEKGRLEFFEDYLKWICVKREAAKSLTRNKFLKEQKGMLKDMGLDAPDDDSDAELEDAIRELALEPNGSLKAKQTLWLD